MEGEVKTDWVALSWKVVISGVICIVLVVAIVNSYRERNNCPTDSERVYIEEVDAAVLWFDATNAELDLLFRKAAEDPEYYTDENWRESVDHHAGTLYLISYDLSQRFPLSQETDELQEYVDNFWAYTSAASEHIQDGLRANDRGMLLEGNRYRLGAVVASREYIDATLMLWPECSIPMAGSKSAPDRDSYGSR